MYYILSEITLENLFLFCNIISNITNRYKEIKQREQINC